MLQKPLHVGLASFLSSLRLICPFISFVADCAWSALQNQTTCDLEPHTFGTCYSGCKNRCVEPAVLNTLRGRLDVRRWRNPPIVNI